MDQPAELFVQANCIAPIYEFLKTLQCHAVRCKIPKKRFAQELCKLSMVQNYIATNKIREKELRLTYQDVFDSSFARSFGDILSRRRLLDQQPPDSEPPTRGQRR